MQQKHVVPVVVLALVMSLTGLAVHFGSPSSNQAPTTADASFDADGKTALSSDAKFWLMNNTSVVTSVAMTPEMRSEIGSNVPRLRVRSYADAVAQPTDLLAVSPRRDAASAGALSGLLARSEPLAVFFDGTHIRQLLEEQTAAEALAARQELGRKIVDDSRIRLTPHAWTALTSGGVDIRVMGLLQRVANVHTIDVFGFPREGPERAARAPARQVHVTAVDGRLVTKGAAAARLRSMITGLPQPYRPAEVGEPDLFGAPDGLLVRFSLPTGG